MKTLSNVVRVLALVLSVGLQSYALPLSAQSIIGEPVQLDFKNEDLESLILLVSRRTGKNFIVDPRVKARVTMITAGPVAADKLYDIFLSVLEVHGFATVPAGRFIKIVPVSIGAQGAVPLAGDRVSIDEPATPIADLVSHVIRVQGTPVDSIIELLRTRVPETAGINIARGANSLVITDKPENIDSVMEIVESLLASQ